ncbi:Lactam utilization protein LamB [hydrothermal vent metagenome]|uniref:Lactam utilization protein LamB n=1 Tax=hydrothermal vent metagenome TaxID=652676 RepID=A0A3B0TJ50_9ZZZZ
MISIDLNADLGEGMAFDKQLLRIVSSASIACGGHAGNEETMEKTLRRAAESGVMTGAHPGFADLENFGRRKLDLPLATIIEQVIGQLQTISVIARRVGQPISYLKLHGALYNLASERFDLAREIFAAVQNFDPKLAIMALAGSAQLRAAKDLGLKTISEGFADRAYRPDGMLLERSSPGAVYSNPAIAVNQAVMLARDKCVIAVDRTSIAREVQSVCLHGDNEAALELARAVRDGLLVNGIMIKSFSGQ